MNFEQTNYLKNINYYYKKKNIYEITNKLI